MTHTEINLWMMVYSGVVAIRFHPRDDINWDTNDKTTEISYLAMDAANQAIKRFRETGAEAWRSSQDYSQPAPHSPGTTCHNPEPKTPTPPTPPSTTKT